MRLDKFLVDVGIGSRKEIRRLLKKEIVTVNDDVVREAKIQVNEETGQITLMGETLTYQKFFYCMLHKPQSVIFTTEDRQDEMVIGLLTDQDYRADLFPVGRLDKDTEGLLLLANDGQLAHQLLSPKKHVDKGYSAEVEGLITAEDCQLFAQRFALKDGEIVRPSRLVIEAINEEGETPVVRLVIQEGKFHQAKWMLAVVGRPATYLKRLRMGELWLDEMLELGGYRPLAEAGLQQLQPKQSYLN